MSLLLLQPVAIASPATSTLQSTSNDPAPAGANALIAAFAEILQIADANNAGNGIMLQISELSQNATANSSPSTDFFAQLISQLKELLQADGNLKVNIGKLPDGKIRDMASENNLINNIVQLMQQMQQQSQNSLAVATNDAGVINLEIAPINLEETDPENNANIDATDATTTANDANIIPTDLWQPQTLPPAQFVAIVFKPSENTEMSAINDIITNDVTPTINQTLNYEQNIIANTGVLANSNDSNENQNDNDLQLNNNDSLADNISDNGKFALDADSFNNSNFDANDSNGNNFNDGNFNQQNQSNLVKGDIVNDNQSNITTDFASNANIADNLTVAELDVTSTDALPLRSDNVASSTPKSEHHGITKINLASLQQISAQIKRLHKGGKSGEINLQLNPTELGKVEIKVSNDDKNNISVQITADLRETYDLLRSDRSSLERILQDNGIINGTNNDGLNFDENNLQFAHREGSNNQENNNKQASVFNEENDINQQLLVDLPTEQAVSLSIATGINISV